MLRIGHPALCAALSSLLWSTLTTLRSQGFFLRWTKAPLVRCAPLALSTLRYLNHGLEPLSRGQCAALLEERASGPCRRSLLSLPLRRPNHDRH